MWFDKVPHNPVKAVFPIHHLCFWCLSWSGATSSCLNMLNMKAGDTHSALFFPWCFFIFFLGGGGGYVDIQGNPLLLQNVYFLIISRAEGSTFFFFPDIHQNQAGKLSHQRWRRSHRRGVCGWCASEMMPTHTRARPLCGPCYICFVFLTQCWQKSANRNHLRFFFFTDSF